VHTLLVFVARITSVQTKRGMTYRSEANLASSGPAPVGSKRMSAGRSGLGQTQLFYGIDLYFPGLG